MAHNHDVFDMENHFEINGSSRFIKETSVTKLVVVQGDHKSEVLTFKMPRYIDGHDMTLCNKIRIHYINLDTKTNNKSADVYEVTDLTLCEECEDVLTFTWTIEAPATKYSGTLSFLVKFECTEGENVLYQWNTAKYVSVNVLAGIDNSEEFVEKYSNVLEEWYNELTKGADSIEELNQQAIAEIELAKEDAKEDIQGKADATMAEMSSYSANTYNSFKNDVDEKAAKTLEMIPDDYSEMDAEVKKVVGLSRNLAGYKIEKVKPLNYGMNSDPKVYRYATNLHLIGVNKYLDYFTVPVRSFKENVEIKVELFNNTNLSNALISKMFTLNNTDEQIIKIDVGKWFYSGEPIVIQISTISGELDLLYGSTRAEFNVDWVEHGYASYNNDYNFNNPVIKFAGVLYFRSEIHEEFCDTTVKTELLEQSKLDKIYSSNKLNPKTFRKGYFAYTQSKKVENYGNEKYGSTDYIPVSEKGLITDGSGDTIGYATGITSHVVYDEEYNPLRCVPNNNQYTYQEGDAYVVYCYVIKDKNIEDLCVVEGTEYYFEKYSEYVPLTKLQEEVENLKSNIGIAEKTQLPLINTSPIYSVLNDYNKNRNYAGALWIDHLISNVDWKDKDIGFGERKDKLYRLYPPIEADIAGNVSENTLSPVIVSSEFKVENPLIVHRCSKASASSNEFPKVLVIGDSVTGGYLANYNKDNADLPNMYWSWVRYYFENDKLECGVDDKNNCLMVGIPAINNIRYGVRDTFKLNNKVYTNYALGKGGWSAEDLNLAVFESDTNINPFYNSTTGKFSLKVALDKFKTLADDGVTRLVVGETAGTEVTDVNAYDFCTPTHVVINLNHNSSLEEYQANIPEIINTIKTEYPNMIVVLMMIDQVGTYFPSEYPNYDSDIISFGGAGLHNKNVSIYNYIKEHLENEANGVYVCSGNLIQPTVDSYPSIEHLLPEFAGDSTKIYHGKSDGGGANYHPNNHAHSAWGYQLYALIKWTLVNKEI